MEQETGEIGVAELEVPLVVELEEGGTVGVVLLQVQVVQLGLGGGVATVLTNIHLKRKSNVEFLIINLIKTIGNVISVCSTQNLPIHLKSTNISW